MSSLKMPHTVVVVPCYNEEARLQPQSFGHAADSACSFRLLFVDDGSSDATGAVLEDIRQRWPSQVDVLTLPMNVGKAEAVRQGVLRGIESGAEAVGFWDADLSTPLEVVSEFQSLLDAHDHLTGVMGSRVQLLGRQIRRSPARHYVGRAFATAASLVLKTPVYDTQCGAKLFRVTPAVRRAFELRFRTSWIFDVELLARLGRSVSLTEAIYEYPLEEWSDVTGSKVRTRDGFRALGDLVRVWAHYR